MIGRRVAIPEPALGAALKKQVNQQVTLPASERALRQPTTYRVYNYYKYSAPRSGWLRRPAPPPEPGRPHAHHRRHIARPLRAGTEQQCRRPKGRLAQHRHACGGRRSRGPGRAPREPARRPGLRGGRGGDAHLLRSAAAAPQGAAGGVRAADDREPRGCNGRRVGGPGRNGRWGADAAGGPGGDPGDRGLRAAADGAGEARTAADWRRRRSPGARAHTCRNQQTSRICR
jgi:hypothetical protein